MKVASLSTLEVSTEMNRGTLSPPLWLIYKPTTGLSWKRERVGGSWSARQGLMLISSGLLSRLAPLHLGTTERVTGRKSHFNRQFIVLTMGRLTKPKP
jgi:hypothetical protein